MRCCTPAFEIGNWQLMAEGGALVAIMLFGAIRSDATFWFAGLRCELLVEVAKAPASHHAVRRNMRMPCAFT
jgi:hypothetical protein